MEKNPLQPVYFVGYYEQINKTRFFKNISQHKLALLAEVHQSQISLIENDLTTAKEDEKRCLAQALGVPPQEILPEKEGD
jgi:transcriptional regulator with XRE-family HTH domain